MFGEVFDTTKSYTSHFTTTDRMQSVLDFPFQDAARQFASGGGPTDALATFFADDDWYTDADSNVYELPTFLGNHDMGRFGGFVVADNPGAGDGEWVARDRLGHELMYFSRGNPVIYYGDEQGFTGPGGDQDARQTLFASRVPEYLDDDLLGTDATHAAANFNPAHPLYRTIAGLASVTARHPAAARRRAAEPAVVAGAGVYAFSRIDRGQQREYVVALNNSEAPATAAVPDVHGRPVVQPGLRRRARPAVVRAGRQAVRHRARTVHCGLRAGRADPAVATGAARSRWPRRRPRRRAGSRSRRPSRGSSLYEVSFEAKVAGGRWQPIGTDDNAPYRVFHDIVDDWTPGTPVEYRAVVLDNGGHTRASNTVARPGARAAADDRGACRGRRRARRGRGPRVGRPGEAVARGVVRAQRRRRAVDRHRPGQHVACVHGVRRPRCVEPGAGHAGRVPGDAGRHAVGGADGPVRRAAARGGELRYHRPAGDYGQWGLHLWGDAVDPAVLAQIAWDKPWPLARVENGWAVYEIPLVDDTKPVNFIMHLPNGDAVPDTREPGGDRSFRPIDSPDGVAQAGRPDGVHEPAP